MARTWHHQTLRMWGRHCPTATQEPSWLNADPALGADCPRNGLFSCLSLQGNKWCLLSVSMATSTLISPLRWQLYLFTEQLSILTFMMKNWFLKKMRHRQQASLPIWPQPSVCVQGVPSGASPLSFRKCLCQMPFSQLFLMAKYQPFLNWQLFYSIIKFIVFVKENLVNTGSRMQKRRNKKINFPGDKQK